MVNKNTLRKLSDRELENYLKPETRFVPEAIEMAFEILEERGRIFSEDEKSLIQNNIQQRKKAEEDKLNEEKEIWRDHITTDQNAIQLFPREIILIMTVFLGTIPGSILLGWNFIKLKKFGAAVLTFVFGFSFLLVQNIIVPFLYYTGSKNFYTLKKNPEFFISALGALILLVFWVMFTPKKLPYRAASYSIPIVISLGMIALIFINPNGLFSNNFLFSIIRDYKVLFD
ncbi:hypothetical protein [Chryseobacterium sp.]|uniref:hypothetical protein n=1 Tax=Chryseobacterium sp. TaxID=1871047 RepID=UPI00289AF97D|nr:hypothetical protein [Chryseobacterium sp.]